MKNKIEDTSIELMSQTNGKALGVWGGVSPPHFQCKPGGMYVTLAFTEKKEYLPVRKSVSSGTDFRVFPIR